MKFKPRTLLNREHNPAHWETSVIIWYRSSLEWVEFSPYEIGMAKYGTFMKTEDFGSKFFCGKKLTPFPEPPLHYMQGKTMVHCNWTVKGMLNMIVQVRVVLNRVTCNQAYIFFGGPGRRLSLGLLLMKVPGRFLGTGHCPHWRPGFGVQNFFVLLSL